MCSLYEEVIDSFLNVACLQESSAAGLTELGMYIDEVSRVLDASGGWKELAGQLRIEHLYSWYANTGSPARTLLKHVKVTHTFPVYRLY